MKTHNKTISGFKDTLKIIVLVVGISFIFIISAQTTFAASCSALCSSQNLEGACDSLDTCIRSDDGTCSLAQIKARIDQASDCETVCYCYEVKEVEDPCVDVKPTPAVIPTVVPTLEPTAEPTPTNTPSEECDPHTVECPQTWTFMVYLNTAGTLTTFARQYFEEFQEFNLLEDPILRCANFVVSSRNYPLKPSHDSCSQLTIRQNELEPTTSPVVCQSLEDFITSVQNNYNTDHYSLTIYGHGGPLHGIGDEHSIHYTHDEMSQAINSAVSKTGKRLNIVEHSSCSTGVFENAYSFSESVDFFSASPDHKSIWIMRNLVERFKNNNLGPCSNLSPKSVANYLTDDYCTTEGPGAIVNFTFNLQKSSLLQSFVNDFFSNLLISCLECDCILESVKNTQRHRAGNNCPDGRDMDRLCENQPTLDLIHLVKNIISYCDCLSPEDINLANDLLTTAREIAGPNCADDAGLPGFNYDHAYGLPVIITRYNARPPYGSNSNQFTRDSADWWRFIERYRRCRMLQDF